MNSWDLSGDWTLSGWRQNDWELGLTPERAKVSIPDVGPIRAPVPGSVRGALLLAGLVADPMVRQQSRLSEWIEHRHWMYSRDLPVVPDSPGRLILRCESLDYAGVVLVDEEVVGSFLGTFIPHEFDLTNAISAGGRKLSIVFTTVPDGLGQNGWTSRIREFKPRFSYGWDWTPRIVQTAIAGPIALERREGPALNDCRITTDATTGTVSVTLPPGLAAQVKVETSDGKVIASANGSGHIKIPDPVPWNVRPAGSQGLYRVRITASDGRELERTVGFRTVTWQMTQSSPPDVEPWLCVVNGTPVFLSGVNWVPIRPDTADVADDEYLHRLTTYRDLGVTILRVWGGAGRERDYFYDLCDELGLLVWQELPLSSSGLDNEPPSDPSFVEELVRIANAYSRDLGHHPCLVMWGGGNELTAVTAPAVTGPPLTINHPTLGAAGNALAAADPGRRFVATSPLGPRFEASASEFGQGLHHDVHGPWEFAGTLGEWQEYWAADDAVMRSEVGVSGASSIESLKRYDLLPDMDGASMDKRTLRQLWTHSSGWWLAGFDSSATDDIVAWVHASQARQAEMLAIAARATLDRFPRSAGFIVWLGHDTFPCAVSLSVLDFDGAVKPAARALGEIFAKSPHTRSG